MSKLKTNETDKLLSTSINNSQNDSMKPLTTDPSNTFKILNNQNNLRSIKSLTSSPQQNGVSKSNTKQKLHSKKTIKSFQNS